MHVYAHTWFLEIVGLHINMCVCVYVSAPKGIKNQKTSSVIWSDVDVCD